MIRDQYANYVIQKMIETAGQEELAMLMARIRYNIVIHNIFVLQ